MECRSLTQAVNDKLCVTISLGLRDRPSNHRVTRKKKSIGSMTDGGGKEEEVSSKISMEESMEQGQIALDESGNLMDDVKIGGVIAGGVIAADEGSAEEV